MCYAKIHIPNDCAENELGKWFEPIQLNFFMTCPYVVRVNDFPSEYFLSRARVYHFLCFSACSSFSRSFTCVTAFCIHVCATCGALMIILLLE
jgi:hypothetical protein